MPHINTGGVINWCELERTLVLTHNIGYICTAVLRLICVTCWNFAHGQLISFAHNVVGKYTSEWHVFHVLYVWWQKVRLASMNCTDVAARSSCPFEGWLIRISPRWWTVFSRWWWLWDRTCGIPDPWTFYCLLFITHHWFTSVMFNCSGFPVNIPW